MFSYEGCQVRSFIGGREARTPKGKTRRLHVAVFSCAAKLDVLGTTDIHTLYENILPCACK